MLDFTSATHLGLTHASAELPGWAVMTSGRPPALGGLAGSADVTAAAARLAGVDGAAAFRSTLHLFLDVFTSLTKQPLLALHDQAAYPIARWPLTGIGSATTVAFRHQDAEDLRRRLRWRRHEGRPVVLTDGLCTGCGRPAPVADYLAELRPHGGLLVIDDTQAVGVLGVPAPGWPLGRGGGGSLRFARQAGADILWGASLAKALGAPIAILGGSAAHLAMIDERGPTRWHCSGPSAADLAAARNALVRNLTEGDRRRSHLTALAQALLAGLRELGLAGFDLPLPVQATAPLRVSVGLALQASLAAAGVECLLQRPRCRPGVALTFLLTVAHQLADVRTLVAVLAKAIRTTVRPSRPSRSLSCAFS